MKQLNRRVMIEVAKEEMREWRSLPRGLVMIILFAFIHRFRPSEPALDYEI